MPPASPPPKATELRKKGVELTEMHLTPYLTETPIESVSYQDAGRKAFNATDITEQESLSQCPGRERVLSLLEKRSAIPILGRETSTPITNPPGDEFMQRVMLNF